MDNHFVKEAFNQFDEKNTGLVATKDLGNVLRQGLVGCNPLLGSSA